MAQRGDDIAPRKADNRFVERVGIDDSARPIDHGLAALGEHGFAASMAAIVRAILRTGSASADSALGP